MATSVFRAEVSRSYGKLRCSGDQRTTPGIRLGGSGQRLIATRNPRDGQASGGVANLREQVDMRNCIARLAEALLEWLLPAAGRHRSVGTPPAARREGAPTFVLPRRVSVRDSGLLRGEDSSLVRPYILTLEEWQERRERRERRLQRGRRRALWLAVHGIDAGPRWIHGVEVVG